MKECDILRSKHTLIPPTYFEGDARAPNPHDLRVTVTHLFVVVYVFVGKPEDMARAILMNAIQNTASMTVWTAMAKNCRTVYMCGGVFEHQLPRELFSFCFEGLALYFGKVYHHHTA